MAPRSPTAPVRGEPIWVTAETQGMVAACYFWPGSEAAINGVRPTFVMPYDDDTPNDERVKRRARLAAVAG